MTQVLDSIILDADCLRYNSKAIVLSAIFCVLGISLQLFEWSLSGMIIKPMVKDIFNQEKCKSDTSRMNSTLSALLASESVSRNTDNNNDVEGQDTDVIAHIKRVDDFVYLFATFLEAEFAMQYEDLIPTIEYVGLFCGGFEFTYELPHICDFSQNLKNSEDSLKLSNLQIAEYVKKQKEILLNRPSEIASLIIQNKKSLQFVRSVKALQS